jgi:hypothetical protein
MDEGTPVWVRLTVDLASGRVLGVRMATKGHFTSTVYSRFERPTTIALPDAG